MGQQVDLTSLLMAHLKIILLALALAALCLTVSASQTDPAAKDTTEFKVMAWNIWRGGREDGRLAGPRRVTDVIRSSGADIIAMQETYGSGEIISRGLGFKFHPRGTNVSIHSRFPVIEDISVFQEFKCVGALLQLPNGSRVAVYSIWLPYDGEIWEPGTRNVKDVPSMLKACASSATDLVKMKAEIDKRLSGERYKGVPIIIAGDFNSMSHLDYTEAAKDHYQAVVDWPTSHVLLEQGFRDSYRDHNPVIDRRLDRTWTPRFPEQEQDRIDFIYHKGQGLTSTGSKHIDSHAQLFPSDHAAVVTSFALAKKPKTVSEVKIKTASYNIRHCAGTDDKLDLERTAKTMAAFQADIIGLQEVDLNCRRSGSVNQPRELGRRLKMHAAFGAFMDYDGGQYGMAILSRFPLVNTQSIRLPNGNEPRVALQADVRLPNGETVSVINVHFDWVDDDKFRFAQASFLADHLKKLTNPYILLGDFNDQPGSRTIKLFQGLAVEAKKPKNNRLTFSSIKPEVEIDFIFAAPASRWQVGSAKVLDVPIVSDHKPVAAELVLKMPAQPRQGT